MTNAFAFVVPIYIGVSAASIVATALVTAIYLSSKRLQADHASTLINNITLADAAFTLKFFIGALAWTAGATDERSSFGLLADNCRFSAAYGQFTGMACVGWNAVWMYDLLVALSNPLVNTAARMRWYHVGVWTVATLTTVALLVTDLHEASDDHTCRPQAGSIDGLLFILPLLLTMALGLLSLAVAFLRLSGGRRNAQVASLRRSLRNRHAAYVIAFILLWAWPLLHDYLDSADEVVSLTVLDAVAVSGQAGVFAAIRLSESGASGMAAALLRRAGRYLCVYPCASCVRGRQAAAAAREADKAALLAAIALGEEAHEQHPLDATTPSRLRTAYSPGATGSRSPAPWFSGKGGFGRRTGSEEVTAATALLGPRSSGSAAESGDRRARAAAMLGAARRRPSVDEKQGGPGEEEAGVGVPPPRLRPVMSAEEAGEGATATPQAQPARTGLASALLSSFSDFYSRGEVGATPEPPGGPLARGSSFAAAEAKAMGSGWDMASASGLRMELGATMLTALVEAVRAGDSRARGGREASVFALASQRARALSLGADGEDEESTSAGGGGTRYAAPFAPAPRRSLASWLKDATTSHLLVPVRHRSSFAAAQKEASSSGRRRSSGGSAAESEAGESDEEEEEVEEVQVTSFADADFAYLRRAAALHPTEVGRGFNPDLLRSGRLRAHFSDGASSSFFCRSADGALVVKTLSAAEVEMLLRLLPAYAAHMAANSDTLLVRFYGCFSLTLGGAFRREGGGGGAGSFSTPSSSPGGAGGRVFFTLMSNVFPVAHTEGGARGAGAAPSKGITTFDLKGSTINRRARTAREGNVLKHTPSKEGGTPADGRAAERPAAHGLQLDIDLRETFPRGLPIGDARTLLSDPATAVATGEDIAAGRGRGAAILDQLRRDVTLLASQNLMDYSLLLQLIPVNTAGGGDEAGEEEEVAAGAFVRVTASGELSIEQLRTALASAANPPRRTPVPFDGGGGGGSRSSFAPADGEAPAGPQLLTSLLGHGIGPEGIAISRWSTLAVSACALGMEGGPGGGSASLYPARAIVQLGVVDVLQLFDTSKRLENALKNLRWGSLTGDADVSAVDPHRYAVRFMEFLTRVLADG